MFRFFKKKESDTQYLYTEKQRNQFEQYVDRQFGSYTEVFHEIVSPDIHLDILIIPPSDAQPFYQLVTMGMGAYKMEIPEQLQRDELERAELVLRLPASWDIKSKKQADIWPIEMLQTIGRIPIQSSTWIGYGHTFSADEASSPFADNTSLCSMALLTGLTRENHAASLRIRGLGKINFYQLFPLYREELLYAAEHSMNALLDLFEDSELNPTINLQRRNCAR